MRPESSLKQRHACHQVPSPTTPAAVLFMQASIPIPGGSAGSALSLTVSASQPLTQLLGPAAYTCLAGLGQDREACNVVANLCVLQMYNQ